MKLTGKMLLGGLLISTASLAQAAFIDPGFTGSTSYDGFTGFNKNYPGIITTGNYPGTAAWSAPFESNTVDSGDATLNKIAGSGYFSSSTTPGVDYIYSTLSGAQTANPSAANKVGTFTLTDLTPVAGLETVMFQIDISFWESVGTAFPTTALYPVLNYNGGTQNLWSNNLELLSRGPLSSEFGTGVLDTWAFQWDLTGITEPITSFSITWSVTNHAQTYGIRLDQGSEYVQVIPEPSTLGLFGLGAAGLACLRRRSPRKA